MPNPLPLTVAESDLSRQLLAAGLTRVHQGKVRDTWELPGYQTLRLVVTTDRTSAFDFILGHGIPGKGKVLNAVNVYWKRQVLKDIPHDLVAAGKEIDIYLLDTDKLRGLKNNPELQARSVVVEVLTMIPVECIARGILTGSAWKMYQEGKREIWGYNPLVDGMKEWDDLPRIMFTPTDKADSGHDEPITREFVRRKYGMTPEALTIELYDRGRRHALNHGLVMVDTKLEVGKARKSNILRLADEAFTPDSSRYVELSALELHRRGSPKPPSFDKQVVRDYLMHATLPDGRIIDVSALDPKDAADRQLVASIVLPEEVVSQTSERYELLLQMLTGANSSIPRM